MPITFTLIDNPRKFFFYVFGLTMTLFAFGIYENRTFGLPFPSALFSLLRFYTILLTYTIQYSIGFFSFSIKPSSVGDVDIACLKKTFQTFFQLLIFFDILCVFCLKDVKGATVGLLFVCSLICLRVLNTFLELRFLKEKKKINNLNDTIDRQEMREAIIKSVAN